MSSLSTDDATQAIELLQQAIGTVGKVVAAAPTATGVTVRVLRDDGPSLRVRLRGWEPGVDAQQDTVWILGKATHSLLAQLRKAGSNFVALSGAVRLVGKGIIIDRSDLRPKRRARGISRHVDPFSDRNSLIVRTLLQEPGKRWGIRELATEAGVSPGMTSDAVRVLTGMGVVAFQRSGRTAQAWVTDPVLLIRRWAGVYSWERNPLAAFAPPMGDPLRFLRRKHTILNSYRWALTLQAGASLVAPHAAWERVHLYVAVPEPSELFEIAAREGWPHADGGRLVLMKPYYKHSVWRGVQTVNDLPVVSDVQLVLDLWNYPLRGIEQAEHILATRDLQR